jgi:xanthine dehydrogenase accessory factor
MNNLYHEIVNFLSKHESPGLATVISRNGSAPRSSGPKMLIRRDGTTAGTVGD